MKASKRFKQSMRDLIINQFGDGPYPSYYRIYFNSSDWVGVATDKYWSEVHRKWVPRGLWL